MTIVISDKVDFRAEKITRYKKGNDSKDERINSTEIHKNPKRVYTKQQSSNYTKQKLMLLKREMNKYTIRVEDFNIPLS